MHRLNVGPLAVWQHETSTPPKGRILMVHGISEHSERHRHTRDFFLTQGWEVVRFDLPGMGESGGRRQWVETFEDYVRAQTEVFNWIERTLPPMPLFVFGHSLGGAISLHFTSVFSKQLKGLMLSAPAFKLGSGIPPLKIFVGRQLSKFFPTIRFPSDTPHWISRDPAEVEKYKKDPLACHFNTVRQGDEVLRALSEIPDKCKTIECPVLICHGSGDRIIQLEGSYEILRLLKSESRTLHVIPHGYHELHNDLDKEDYFPLLTQWLNTIPLQSRARESKTSNIEIDKSQSKEDNRHL